MGVAGLGSAAGAPAAWPGQSAAALPATQSGPLRLNYNENPLGLSPSARQAVSVELDEIHRYPDALRDVVRQLLAKRNGVRKEHVVLGKGSTEILQMIVQAASSPNAGLVLANPTFEAMSRYQRPFSYRIEKVPRLTRKQGAYSVVAATGLILKRGHDLKRVLAVVDRSLRPVGA